MEYQVIIKNKILKKLSTLPESVQDRFEYLVDDLTETGPTQPNSANYSKLSKTEYHCHLPRSWVACWTHEKKTIIIEVYYVALVKKPRTKTPVFEITGEIPKELLDFIKNTMNYVIDIDNNNDDEYQIITDSDWYKERKTKRTPGQDVCVYRDNFGFSQARLGEIIGGLSHQNISDMENNRRGISKDMAKKLSKVF